MPRYKVSENVATIYHYYVNAPTPEEARKMVEENDGSIEVAYSTDDADVIYTVMEVGDE